MQILTHIAKQVALLDNQPVHFLRGHFSLEQGTGYWTPAIDPDGKYPMILADVLRLRVSDDFRLATYSLSLMYAEPHLENLTDVPEIQTRAAQSLQQLLANLCAAEDIILNENPELVFFMHSGPNRLAGANALVSLNLPNDIPLCSCP